MQIWAEPRNAALPICNYSQILYQFLTFTQNLKRSRISEYELNNLIPDDYKSSMPTIEEIERELKD